MRTTMTTLLIAWIVAAVPSAHAQEESAPEAQATIKPGETARLDRDSIGEYGATRRFDVDIWWNDAAGPRPSEHRTRKIRYVADCRAGTLTLAAVAVFDRSGMVEKRMIVPPGASDPIKPEPGSPQAKWHNEVCAA